MLCVKGYRLNVRGFLKIKPFGDILLRSPAVLLAGGPKAVVTTQKREKGVCYVLPLYESPQYEFLTNSRDGPWTFCPQTGNLVDNRDR